MRTALAALQNIAGHSGEIPVAVKTLTSRLNEVIQKFMEEIELMKKFAHPNIVSLLGKWDIYIVQWNLRIKAILGQGVLSFRERCPLLG